MTGINPALLIGGAEMVNGCAAAVRSRPAAAKRYAPAGGQPTDQLGQFVAKILGENEEVWSQVLPAQKNIRFQPPKLVMFDGPDAIRLRRGGVGDGPFYCPLDQKIYLDTSFLSRHEKPFRRRRRLAYAYVISHEMGHHIENQLGILPKVHQAQERASSRAQANALSVRIELMADCLAASGPRTATPSGSSLKRETSRRPSRPHKRLATTAYKRASRGGVVPDLLHPRLLGAARTMAATRLAVGTNRQLQHVQPSSKAQDRQRAKIDKSRAQHVRRLFRFLSSGS